MPDYSHFPAGHNVQKKDTGKVVLASSIAIGQFTQPVTILVAGDPDAGYILREKGFPARIVLAETSLQENILQDDALLLPAYSGKADIYFIALKELSFPSDFFLTERGLEYFRGKTVPGGGVLALLLPDLDADLLQKILDETRKVLSRDYANILSISNPRMLLASNLPLTADPVILENNLQEVCLKAGKKSIFPEGFLQIFTPELTKSSLYQRQKNIPAPSFSLPLPFIVQEKLFEGAAGEILEIFHFWAAFYRKYFWFFWGFFLPGYFIFRYFFSPGERRKRLFLCFEHTFFITAIPLGVILSFPEKWQGRELLFFYMLLPGFFAFFTAYLWREDAGENFEKIPSSGGVKRSASFRKDRFLSHLPPVCTVLILWIMPLLLPLKMNILPGGTSFHVLTLGLLLITAGTGGGLVLLETLKNLEQKSIPEILLAVLAGTGMAFLLVFPVAYSGSWLLLIPLMVFMTILQYCVLRKN